MEPSRAEQLGVAFLHTFVAIDKSMVGKAGENSSETFLVFHFRPFGLVRITTQLLSVLYLKEIKDRMAQRSLAVRNSSPQPLYFFGDVRLHQLLIRKPHWASTWLTSPSDLLPKLVSASRVVSGNSRS